MRRRPPASGSPAQSDDAQARRGRHISSIRVVRRPVASAALIAGLLVAGIAAAGLSVASQTGKAAAPVRPPVNPTKLVPIPHGTYAAPPPAASRTVAEPVSLLIPAIGVRTRLVHLGITSGGTLQVPGTTAVAGWYTGSPRPGEPGGAVIAGHIDSRQAKGVFYLLRLLRPGERVFVRRADGTLAAFQITVVRSYPKTRFPTSAVYGPTPDAQIRLITCGGTFDWTTGHYLSNTIVYASLVS